MLLFYALILHCYSYNLPIHTSSQWCYIKLRIHSRTLGSPTCSENLFFHELLANQGKMTNQLRQQLCENCWRDGKIFPQTRKRTKIQTNMVSTELRTSMATSNYIQASLAYMTTSHQLMLVGEASLRTP